MKRKIGEFYILLLWLVAIYFSILFLKCFFDCFRIWYVKTQKNPEQHPILPNNSFEIRLELLFDLFKIIYADNRIEPKEKSLILKYAIGLGFNSVKAEVIIEKSILIFEGKLDFEEYSSLIKK